jgi:hypothetical protein
MVHFEPHELLMSPAQIPCRLAGRPSGRDQHIARELKIELLKAKIVCASADTLHSFIGGKGIVCIERGAKMKRHASIHGLVDGLLPGENLRGAVCSGPR